MPIKERVLILDLYLFNTNEEIAAVDRAKDDLILGDTLTMIILSLPLGVHPILYLKQYIGNKNLRLKSLTLLPAIYLNTFDSEPDKEYLVTSYKAIVEEGIEVVGDDWNQNINWMDFNHFCADPKLMQEFRKNKMRDLINGHEMYYQGFYRDSDNSNEIISWKEV